MNSFVSGYWWLVAVALAGTVIYGIFITPLLAITYCAVIWGFFKVFGNK